MRWGKGWYLRKQTEVFRVDCERVRVECLVDRLPCCKSDGVTCGAKENEEIDEGTGPFVHFSEVGMEELEIRWFCGMPGKQMMLYAEI